MAANSKWVKIRGARYCKQQRKKGKQGAFPRSITGGEVAMHRSLRCVVGLGRTSSCKLERKISYVRKGRLLFHTVLCCSERTQNQGTYARLCCIISQERRIINAQGAADRIRGATTTNALRRKKYWTILRVYTKDTRVGGWGGAHACTTNTKKGVFPLFRSAAMSRGKLRERNSQQKNHRWTTQGKQFLCT